MLTKLYAQANPAKRKNSILKIIDPGFRGNKVSPNTKLIITITNSDRYPNNEFFKNKHREKVTKIDRTNNIERKLSPPYLSMPNLILRDLPKACPLRTSFAISKNVRPMNAPKTKINITSGVKMMAPPVVSVQNQLQMRLRNKH